MKKVCILLLSLTLAVSSFAQDSFSWGVKGGLNLSSMYGGDFKDMVNSKKMKANFYAGITTELRISNLFAVSPELVYSAEGTHFKTNVEGLVGTSEVKVKLNSHYLNIPIMAKFYVAKRFSLNVGPQVGFNMGMKIKAGGESEKLDKSDYHKIALAACLGATYNFERFFIEARYNLGLTNVVKDFDNKNCVFQFGVGYKF